MEQKNLANELKERFERLYKDCKIFCVHLNGFSHSVFYKDKDGTKHIDGYSAYAPEQYEDDHKTYNSAGDMAIQSWNKDRTKAFFLGFAHMSYSHDNATEICFEDVSKW